MSGEGLLFGYNRGSIVVYVDQRRWRALFSSMNGLVEERPISEMRYVTLKMQARRYVCVRGTVW